MRSLWLGLVLPVLAQERPAECPESSWTTACSHQATCETLALAGLTCAGVKDIAGCAGVCADPCCITTTTTTATTATHTVTHTSTSTFTETSSSTDTSTSTGTSTTSSTTATASGTSTSSATSTSTHTATVTATTGTTTTGTIPTTTSIPVAPTLGPAALMKLAMRVSVQDAEDFRNYFSDIRVEEAYLATMMDLTNASADMVAVAFSSAELGVVQVLYTVTIPYVSSGAASVPSVSVEEVRGIVTGIDIPTFNQMLDKEMEHYTDGEYTQEVLTVMDVSEVVSGTPRMAIVTWLAVLAVLLLRP